MSGSDATNWRMDQARLRLWYGGPAGRALYSEIRRQAADMLRGLHARTALQVAGGHPGRRDAPLIDLAAVVHPIFMTGDSDDDLVACPAILPIASDSLDLVVLFHTLELSRNPAALFAECARVLSSDGHLFVVHFNQACMRARRQARIAGCNSRVGTRQLVRLAQEHDLELVEQRGCWMRPLAESRRLRRATAWLEHASGILGRMAAVRLVLLRRRTIPLNPIVHTDRLRRIPEVEAGHAQPT